MHFTESFIFMKLLVWPPVP